MLDKTKPYIRIFWSNDWKYDLSILSIQVNTYLNHIRIIFTI